MSLFIERSILLDYEYVRFSDILKKKIYPQSDFSNFLFIIKNKFSWLSSMVVMRFATS